MADLHVLCRVHGTMGINQEKLLGQSEDPGGLRGCRLGNSAVLTPGPWGEIHGQEGKLTPVNTCEELLERLGLELTLLIHRLTRQDHGSYRDHFGPVRVMAEDLLAFSPERVRDPHHHPDVRASDISIEETHLLAPFLQRVGEVHGGRRLPDLPFPRNTAIR